jgi:hypothetical protein
VDAGAVGGFDGAEVGAGAIEQEVFDALAWGLVGAAAELVGGLFELTLEVHAAEGAGGEVLGFYADDDACVGVFAAAFVLAHAVGDEVADFGGGGDDLAAGAHAEAIYRSAVAGVVDEFVVGGSD